MRNNSIWTTEEPARRLRRSPRESITVRELALNYYAGETIDDAAAVGRDLAGKGLRLGFTYLDQDLETDALMRLLAVTKRLNVTDEVELTVLPDQLGLHDGVGRASDKLTEFCQVAAEGGAVVTLGGADYTTYASVLELHHVTRELHPDLGITLPADIKRAERDLHSLARAAARVRIGIGADPAPSRIGYRKEHDKSLALVRCLRILYESRARPMVASHDARIIEIAQELARRNHRSPSDHEFQMSYGVRPLEQRRLVDIGLTCRTNIPFGPSWYEHLTTRIITRPHKLWIYLRALFDKR